MQRGACPFFHDRPTEFPPTGTSHHPCPPHLPDISYVLDTSMIIDDHRNRTDGAHPNSAEGPEWNGLVSYSMKQCLDRPDDRRNSRNAPLPDDRKTQPKVEPPFSPQKIISDLHSSRR